MKRKKGGKKNSWTQRVLETAPVKKSSGTKQRRKEKPALLDPKGLGDSTGAEKMETRILEDPHQTVLGSLDTRLG